MVREQSFLLVLVLVLLLLWIALFLVNLQVSPCPNSPDVRAVPPSAGRFFPTDVDSVGLHDLRTSE